MINAKAWCSPLPSLAAQPPNQAKSPLASQAFAGMVSLWPAAPSATAGDARLPPPGAQALQGPDAQLIVCYPPLAHYLRRHPSAESIAYLHNALADLHIDDVPMLPSELVAAAGTGEVEKQFNYQSCWWRDIALVALGLGDERTERLAHGLAHNALTPNQMHRFLTGVAHGAPACDSKDMPQIKISADGSDLKTPWGHNQLDALGLGTFLMVTSADDACGCAIPDQIKAASLVTSYLTRIGYTRVQCNGHWEESGPMGKGASLTSSLGCVVHGMKALDRWIRAGAGRAAALDDYLRSLDGTDSGFGEELRTTHDDGTLVFSFARGDHLAAINEGAEMIRARRVGGIWHETMSDAMSRRRTSDLALTTFLMLELAAPPTDRVLSRDDIIEMTTQLERDLKGPIGYRRYDRDGWLAAYPGADDADPNARALLALSICDRDKMTPGTSPEWTLGNGAMGHIFGRLYIETGDVRFRDKATENVNRLVGNITPDPAGPGKVTLNESFMQVRDGDRWRYVGNGLNLNWSRAYVHLAVETLRDMTVIDCYKKPTFAAAAV